MFFLQDSAVSGTLLGPLGEPDMLQSRPVTLPGRGTVGKDSNYLILLTAMEGWRWNWPLRLSAAQQDCGLQSILPNGCSKTTRAPKRCRTFRMRFVKGRRPSWLGSTKRLRC